MAISIVMEAGHQRDVAAINEHDTNATLSYLASYNDNNGGIAYYDDAKTNDINPHSKTSYIFYFGDNNIYDLSKELDVYFDAEQHLYILYCFFFYIF